METEEQDQGTEEQTDDPGDAPVTERTETTQPASLPSDEEREGGATEEGTDSEEGGDEDGATDEDAGGDEDTGDA